MKILSAVNKKKDIPHPIPVFKGGNHNFSSVIKLTNVHKTMNMLNQETDKLIQLKSIETKHEMHIEQNKISI